MTEIVKGLFGFSPQELAQQRDQELTTKANAFAQLSPEQRATQMLYRGGNQLAGAVGGMLGAQDPQMKKSSDLQSILQGGDLNSVEGLKAMGDKAAALGYGTEAQQMYAKAQETAQAQAMTRKTTAEASKVELDAAREENLRKELAALPEGFTNADVEKVVVKYGGADKVLATLTAAQARTAAAEAKVEAAKVKADADLKEAAQRGADARTLEQMRIASDQKIAAMQNETRQMMLSMKPPSASQLKAEADATKKAEGKEGLADTLYLANKLVDDLVAEGGITDTTKGGIVNTARSLGASGMGQFAGRVTGSSTQAKRDELKSVRLQLFNAVKAATGMSSKSIDSNVELKTWLDSLGSDGMSAQANRNILKNIENNFLKGYDAAPNGGEAKGKASKPIKLD